MYVNPLFLLENKKSKVIYVRGLENQNLKIQWLMNLFLNFGNVTKICLMRDKMASLIEFEDIEFATQSKDFLNNTKFFGFTLKIFYSNYPSISLRKKNSLNEEILDGDPSFYRFKTQAKPYSINPPSAILHLSNLKKEACSYEVICKYFGCFG